MDFLSNVEYNGLNEDISGIEHNCLSIITINEHDSVQYLKVLARKHHGNICPRTNPNTMFSETIAPPYQSSPLYKKLAPTMKLAVDDTMETWSKLGRIEDLEKAAKTASEKRGVQKKDILDFFERVVLGEAINPEKDDEDEASAARDFIDKEQQRNKKRYDDMLTKAKIKDLEIRQQEKEKEDKEKHQSESVITTIKSSDRPIRILHPGNKRSTLQKMERMAVLDIFDKLNEENRITFEKKLTASPASFRELVDFCVNQSFGN